MKQKEIIGWIGVILILCAYALSVFGVIKPSSIPYATLNIVGSVGIIVSSRRKRDFQPVFLNTAWIIIAVIGLARMFF